ncbi:MAG: Crp/Fnr family transcriptional regulator [Syntrophales bacterium]|jgi:CRP/FNR family transcriptional regulator/CRP/FNR family cyclic AMP-dependent transcriptional regulator|nr:Crp/Fnr family transcriptional regulator [Syntrophales bacterium]MDY0044594.1 Crp/Fnr family transcriptional regulator [Syntrophales bacterium]
MDAEEFLKGVNLFQCLNDEECRILAASLKKRSLKRGEYIFRKGDEGNCLYIIQKGRIKITLLSERGEEVIPALLSKGECFGEMALLDGMDRSADAIALEDSELYSLSRNDFISFLHQHKEAIAAVMAFLSTRLRKTDGLLADLCFLSVPERLAKRLAAIAEEYGPLINATDSIEIPMAITQTDLANLVGTSRETINRELKTLKEAGIIDFERTRIRIHNLEKLKQRYRTTA